MLIRFVPSSFDGTYLYDYTFLLLYALLFTSLPVVVLGGGFLAAKLIIDSAAN
jgi:magnesium-transporting ATPase (P-type)